MARNGRSRIASVVVITETVIDNCGDLLFAITVRGGGASSHDKLYITVGPVDISQGGFATDSIEQ